MRANSSPPRRAGDSLSQLHVDIVTARQAEDTFKTFREAGRTLGIQRLAQIGETGERDHDDYVKQANRLAQQLFVEHVLQGDTNGLNISPNAATSVRDNAAGFGDRA